MPMLWCAVGRRHAMHVLATSTNVMIEQDNVPAGLDEASYCELGRPATLLVGTAN